MWALKDWKSGMTNFFLKAWVSRTMLLWTHLRQETETWWALRRAASIVSEHVSLFFNTLFIRQKRGRLCTGEYWALVLWLEASQSSQLSLKLTVASHSSLRVVNLPWTGPVLHTAAATERHLLLDLNIMSSSEGVFSVEPASRHRFTAFTCECFYLSTDSKPTTPPQQAGGEVEALPLW